MHQCLFHTNCRAPVTVPALGRWFTFEGAVDAPAGDDVPEDTSPQRRCGRVGTHTGKPQDAHQCRPPIRRSYTHRSHPYQQTRLTSTQEFCSFSLLPLITHDAAHTLPQLFFGTFIISDFPADAHRTAGTYHHYRYRSTAYLNLNEPSLLHMLHLHCHSCMQRCMQACNAYRLKRSEAYNRMLCLRWSPDAA